MNNEVLEHELTKLDGKPIVLIVPSFGHASFSYAGILTATTLNNDHMIRFHFVDNAGSMAVLFFVEDVMAIKEPSASCVSPIVELRGPHDYRQEFQKTYD